MPGVGEGHKTAGGEGVPGLACRSGAASSSSQPSLDFVGKMKTFHTFIDIPGTTAMDFHLVTAQTEVIEKFHWLHNKDKHAKVGVWCPISFADAPDCTKRRTVLYSSPLNIPAWLQNILGRSTMEVKNEEETTLNRANGNLTISSRSLITASGGDGASEYELAAVYYQILNRRAADGAAYITVDVTVTAKADQPWLWGLQSAVEAIFIAQAKDDILAFLEYSLRLFRELHCTQQLPSQQKLRASKSRPGATPRVAVPGGSLDRKVAPQTPRGFKHVSSGPTLTAALPQQWGPESAPVELVTEDRVVRGALTPRYVKPETRSRRAPKTARPANGLPSSRVLYERPSTPTAVEWETPPVSPFEVQPAARSPATMPLRDLIPNPELSPDISDSSGPASEEAHHEEWGAEEQPRARQHYSTLRQAQRADRVAQKTPEHGRYYIIMPAEAAARHEPPRVLEEVYTEGEVPGQRRFLALREVASRTAREYVPGHQPQPRRHVPAAKQRGGKGEIHGQQAETRAATPAKRVTFPEAPADTLPGVAQSHLPSSPEEEQRVPVQQPQRRGNARGSQTARVDSSHALSESRKEMAEAKSSVQDTLRRVSAEMAQSEAQRCNPEAFHAHSKMKQKKRNWFMQLFKGGGKGGRDGQ